MRHQSEQLTVVSPTSLESWYGRFCGAETDVLFIGETGDDVKRLADLISRRSRSGQLRILSGHDSLLRDWALASELRRRGHSVDSQSPMAVSAGLDKILQKQLLEYLGVPVPDWGLFDETLPTGTRLLCKGRASTQSRAISWLTDSAPPKHSSYWEAYIEGVEYSVVVYRDRDQLVRFPPVWKGPVSDDLTPPWKRLRLVPAGLVGSTATAMDEASLQIAEFLDLWGFGEVEFIVNGDGAALVTEVNPRVCGTMRIVAMATNLPIFDSGSLSSTAQPEALLCAAEVPYDGEPFATKASVATSRLTCAGADPSAVLKTLADQGHAVDPRNLPRPWRAN